MRKNVYYRTDRGQRLGAGRHALKATREVIHVTKGDTVRVTGRIARVESLPSPVTPTQRIVIDPATVKVIQRMPR